MREPLRPADQCPADQRPTDQCPTDPRAAVIWEAFREDPLACWAAPDRATRHELYALWSAALIASGDGRGRIVGDPERGVVQVWWSCETEAPEILDDTQVDALFRAAGPEVANRFGEVMAGMDAVHPRSPHEYLVVIGVHPDRQRRGIGRRALADALERFDAAGRAAYLEATTSASRRLYQRLGFRDLGEPLRVAGDAPVLYPMWRDPAGADRTP